MKIKEIRSYTGRNIYSHRPVIRMLIDLEDLHGMETKDISGFNEKLLELLPGLCRHCCSPGFAGGFIKRLQEGTYIGHVIEHIALELQCMIGYDVRFGKTRMAFEPSVYFVVFEYINERCGVECAKIAVNIAHKIAKGEYFDISKVLDSLKRLKLELELGPTTKAIYEEAKKRGIPVERVGNDSILQLGHGKYSRFVEASLVDSTSCIAVDIASNKQLTRNILANHNIPVPAGDIAYTEDSAVMLAEEIGYPVAVKPCDANQGKGVSLGIMGEEQLRIAFREALKYSRAVIVEKYVKGRDYRVLVVGGKVSAVSERQPPFVVGDGIHTLSELIEMENRNELRGEDHEKPLTKIKLDEISRQVLSSRGLTMDYIPSLGEKVNLRQNGNLSTGGTARDCTAEIHPCNSQLAARAAKAIGLDIAGVDIITDDISVPINSNNGAVIEINAAPGLRMHLFPTEGQPKNVAVDIMDMLFPKGRPYTVPIVSVTGTNGKTTTTRLIKHVLSLTGVTVGMTSTSGVYVGDECIMEGDNTGPISAKLILSDRRVEAAVFETARGGIIKRGLGYDLADVGVITNISDDHLGLDGIDTIRDMAFVKSLVIEAIKPDGYAVLNANDVMVNYLLSRVKCKPVLFSTQYENLLVRNHIKSGGRAVFVNDRAIYVHDGGVAMKLIDVGEIPITLGGIAECNIENSLAAISALYSLNVPADVIRNGLKSFKPNLESNPGRFNIFDMGDFKVMLDYCHNPAGYNAVAKFIHRFNAARYVGIVGMPGDRLDRNYREAAEICGSIFSKIYIKEDEDLRGRKPGEVARIFYDTIINMGVRTESVEIVLNEIKALEKAILDAQPGDFIVMFYEKLKPAIEFIEKFKKEIKLNMLNPMLAVEDGAVL